MDHLWTSALETPQKKQNQEQTAEFIKVKEDEVKGISQHFYSLNHMDYSAPQNLGNENNMKEKPQTPPIKNPH